jgi:hypothetical protein
MRALIRAPSSSQMAVHFLIANERSLADDELRRLGAPIAQLLALWMTRMMRGVGLRETVRLRLKGGV